MTVLAPANNVRPVEMSAVERRGPARKSRRSAKRVLMTAFALAWAVGCAFILVRVFSAVRAKCAGCVDCAGTAP